MNPFTKFLSQFLKSASNDIATFIGHFDQVENLAISVYKRKAIAPKDTKTFENSFRWLQTHYPDWEEQLASYWPPTLVGGKPAPMDPFRRLIYVEGPESFIDDWEALQYLPAAREALNQYLVDQSNDGG